MARTKMVRFVSDGTENGTDVKNWDGKHIPGVQRVTLILEPGRPPRAVLEFAPFSVDMLVPAREVEPAC